MSAWLWLAMVALFLWGITGVTQKLSTNYVSSSFSFLWFAVAFPFISVAVLLSVAVKWPHDPGLLALIALGGLLNGLGAWTSFAALESGGKASIVIPLVYMYPLVTVAGAWLLLGERISFRQGLGVILAILAVILLSREASSG
jgi:transporter family protein